MFKIFIKAYRGTREAWEWKNALEKKCHSREGGNPGAVVIYKEMDSWSASRNDIRLGISLT